jgi:RNA polymerase sigma-70 factor (ECF subfamily)
MPVLTDDHWVADHLERWRTAKDPEALGELLKWQRDRAFAVACRVLTDRAEAEDAVQQAFLKLFRSAPAFEGPSAFHAALYRSVTQCAIDLARTKHARRVMEHAMAQRGRSTVSASPGDAVEQREAVRILQQEMQTLTPEDRALLALCCQEGLSLVSAAETLDLPRETARDRLARLLNDLRHRLAKRGVAMSLLLLVGLFQQGRAVSAAETLCLALDGTLPGATCAGLAPAAAVAVPASAVLAQAGLSAGLLAGKVLIGAGVAAFICAGAVTWAVLRVPVPVPAETQLRPVTVAPTTVVKESAPTSAVAHPIPAPVAPAVQLPAKPVAEVPPPHEPKADKGAEKKIDGIPLAAVPAVVRAAVVAKVPGIQLTKADQDVKNDQVVYELDGRVGDRRFEIQVTADGRVLNVKEDNENDDEKDGDEKGGKGKEKGVPPPAPPKAEGEF